MKEIIVKKLKPLFTSVITTLDTYEEDFIENGIVVFPKGTLRMYQTVVAVGNLVKDIKEGDKVLINYNDYIVRKYRENSLKEDMEKMEDIPVLNVPKILIGDKIYGKFQDRNIEGIIEEFEEYETEKPKKGLI